MLRFLLPLTIFLFASSNVANACSCGRRPTVLDSYDGSDVVVITRLLSVEKVANTEERHYVDGVRSATMVVEKVFKGNLKISDQIVFGQGGGADCIWTFNEKWVGDQFLFYLDAPKKDSDRSFLPFNEGDWWYAVTCGRSTGVEYATEDLLYLENMSKLRGKTRISGSVGGGWRNPEMEVENKLVKIIGSKKTYELKTDSHGVFEIYDLPPGKYLVEPEIPTGYKLDRFVLRYSPSVASTDEDEAESKSLKKIPIVLEPKKHASVNIGFEIDNAVRGKVSDPTGKPMYGVCVYLWRPDQKDGFGPFDCTDEEGQFEITEVPTGEYIVVANNDGKLSAREPFKTLYYPGVSERARAAIVTIGPGGVVNDINIVVPKLEDRIVVEGVLKYSDGKPVAEEWVEFEAEKVEGIDGDARGKTDSAGHFSLNILKNLKGQLFAEDWIYKGEYVNCPKLDRLIKESGNDHLTIKTNVITVVAEKNLYNLDLTFPFPRCEKAKE
ncbi:MAG TPA: SpaA isopeptide-forming pilin-related protein [Pyrinomonadaceae bacterium]|nr:SpaA isopeptide-forming pilin-related protein [Pyrinomonadaceae bacterium]